MQNLLEQYLSSFAAINTLDVLTAKQYMSDLSIKILLLSLPVLIVSALLSGVLVAAQTRSNVAWSRIKPDFSKLNPIKGLKNLISLRSLTELLKSILKISVVTMVAYTEIKANFPAFISLLDKSILASFAWLCQTTFFIIIKIGIYLLAFGILDYFYQWWDYERQIRMSFQEVRDEFKETEGDPQIKGRIRERQRRMAMLRMAQKVPLADVVIKNPTHYAVAIKYDSPKDKAPKVIAKGQDYLALKIIEIAEANHIVVTANPPLARGLYESVALDQEIPEKYYQAVAEILVFVYTKLHGNNRPL